MKWGFWVTYLPFVTTFYPNSFGGKMPNNYTGLIAFLYSIFVFLPGLSVTVRRLHDIGKSGWWYLFFIIVTIIPAGMVAIVISAFKTTNQSVLWLLLITLIAAVWIIVWLATPSQMSPNKYGEIPDDIQKQMFTSDKTDN
ncbi:DUF805 domain-containing protein [Caldisericum sp.]|uniref:DUF805 domain-containing protein n=1 Tax=Caldisericum sp. TaxID=2499687 RepID=UPI003D09A796